MSEGQRSQPGRFSTAGLGGHARTSSSTVQPRKASDASDESASSQVTTVNYSSSRPGLYALQNHRAASSTTSLASSRATSTSRSDLPLRQTSPAIAAAASTSNSKMRQHSQGFFEPSLGSLTASTIAAQAATAMHSSQTSPLLPPHHIRRKSQIIPEPLNIGKINTSRKASFPPPIQTAPLPPTSSRDSANTMSTSLQGGTAATYAANAAFPRTPLESPVPQTPQTQIHSPASYFEKETTPSSKPQKKESRMKLFSKPKHMKDPSKGSPKSIYSSATAASSRLNQSTASLAESTMSSAASFYASTNASTSTLVPPDRISSDKTTSEKKHHFLSRQKQKLRDNIDHHHLPLSSASSNSRPVDPSAPQPLYSFAPSSPGPGSKSISGFDLRHGGKALREKRKEEKAAAVSTIPLPPIPSAELSRSDLDAFGPASSSTFTSQISTELGLPNPSLGAFGLQGMGADDAWPLLKARLLNIFEGEDLRTPIEDFNRLLSIHLRACIQRRAPAVVVEDLRELLWTGFSSLDQTLRSVPEARLVSHLVDMWQYVFGTILPFIQAVFLPLDQEFKGQGPIMTAREAADFWSAMPVVGHRPSVATITQKTLDSRPPVLDVRTMVLQTFRDWIVLPRYDTLMTIFSRLSIDSINHAAVHADSLDRPSTASSGAASSTFNSALPVDPSSFNSQSSTLLDSSNGNDSLGARSRATSNTSAGSFPSVASSSSRPSHGNRPRQQPHQRQQSTTAPLTVDSARVTATAARMLQCISVLAALSRSLASFGIEGMSKVDTIVGDDGEELEDVETSARRKMERLAAELKLNWLGRARTGRNRRGLVGTKPSRSVGVNA